MKALPQLITDIKEWPIHKFSNNRTEFIKQVVKVTFEQFKELDTEEIDQAIAKAIYLEKQRIKVNPWKADPPNEAVFFKKLQSEYNENILALDKRAAHLETLHRLIKRYAEEIGGHFNPNTFQFARKILSVFFYNLLNPIGFHSFTSISKMKEKLESRIQFRGNIESIRSQFKKNIVVVLPTHSSNLDSMLIGYSLDLLLGLPAFSYGAGLNLYDSEFFAFFMNRLGAYKVDRRKKNRIYLQTLNDFSRLSVQEGVNSIFFPGGTRSRSGEVEMKAKLGLISSLITAQRDLIEQHSDKKIIIFPLVLSYESVLEARSLMLQHLKSAGQEKYTAREHMSTFSQYYKFTKRIVTKGSNIYLTIGEGIDVFGNKVLENNSSVDTHGHVVDLKNYFMSDGEFKHDPQRESIYTKELAELVCAQYVKFNFILPCHLVAFTAFKLMQKSNPGHDIFSLVQLPEEEIVFELEIFYRVAEEIRSLLFEMNQNNSLIKPDLLEGDIKNVVNTGIETLGIFHIKRPLFIDSYNRLLSEDFIALSFYSNKMCNLDLDAKISWNKLLPTI
ncbi:MAG TPA: 1-acyl-sn-glycerol-3-phosphate acyltransferase [Saprospiraceae bacterium]|jgi:glycerol-3-phosphate O-acyltransferase|nr:1-acyl-sn-glycerol-3-phosphate acyltransferase [Saprospiraceae bacterium]